jgi:hypothetical protein
MERLGLAATMFKISRRSKYGGLRHNVRCPRSEGSSNGDHALPHRYPLATFTPNVIELEPG